MEVALQVMGGFIQLRKAYIVSTASARHESLRIGLEDSPEPELTTLQGRSNPIKHKIVRIRRVA